MLTSTHQPYRFWHHNNIFASQKGGEVICGTTTRGHLTVKCKHSSFKACEQTASAVIFLARADFHWCSICIFPLCATDLVTKYRDDHYFLVLTEFESWFKLSSLLSPSLTHTSLRLGEVHSVTQWGRQQIHTNCAYLIGRPSTAASSKAEKWFGHQTGNTLNPHRQNTLCE